ncbi:MAG: dTMP kinase [Deltaproteobacteria bacterium]|nr:dTMP kinase [Deltaproteobacteria bacterium]
MLIALEGIDGAGKTTQARLLAAALEERGWPVVLTREPTEGPHGERLRRYLAGPTRHLSPEEELELFTADRRDHVREIIQPALAAGRTVVTDRYYYSSAAYQGALGLDPVRILEINEAFAPQPHLVFILTLPLDQALARLQEKRQSAPQVSEAPAYLAKVAALYDGFQGDHLHRVDASEPSDTVHARILETTLEFLEAK